MKAGRADRPTPPHLATTAETDSTASDRRSAVTTRESPARRRLRERREHRRVSDRCAWQCLRADGELLDLADEELLGPDPWGAVPEPEDVAADYLERDRRNLRALASPRWRR